MNHYSIALRAYHKESDFLLMILYAIIIIIYIGTLNLKGFELILQLSNYIDQKQ